jgi:hypothetical protein
MPAIRARVQALHLHLDRSGERGDRMTWFVPWLVVVFLAGCAATSERGPASMDASASPATEEEVLAGHWHGVVWQTGAWYVQGRKRVDLMITDDGTWRGTIGSRSASGVIRRRGGHVVITGTSLAGGGSSDRVYYRLAGDDDRLWGETLTDFAGRPGRASVALERST